MKGKRYTEEQIISVLNRHESGVTVESICRDMGIAQGTLLFAPGREVFSCCQAMAAFRTVPTKKQTAPANVPKFASHGATNTLPGSTKLETAESMKKIEPSMLTAVIHHDRL